MTDIGERYRLGAKSSGENYIGKGILLIVTVSILILSLRPFISSVVKIEMIKIIIKPIIQMIMIWIIMMIKV